MKRGGLANIIPTVAVNSQMPFNLYHFCFECVCVSFFIFLVRVHVV